VTFADGFTANILPSSTVNRYEKWSTFDKVMGKIVVVIPG